MLLFCYIAGMTLREYLEQTGEGDTEFGARAGVHRTRIWSYRTGKTTPGMQIAKRIFAATGGKVAFGFERLLTSPRKRRTSRKAA